MKRTLQTLGWLFRSFGPLVSFYAILKVWGLVPAIVSGLAIGVVLVAYEIWREKRASTMTIFTAASVAVFGGLDLYFRTGFFVKLEPALGNAATGIFFLGTVVLGKPLLAELVLGQSKAEDDKPIARRYLRNLTILWGLFFFVRTAAYVWMAYNLTLERALVVRGVAGPVSLGVMFVGEMGYRYLRYGKQAFEDPSEAPAVAPEPAALDSKS